MKTAVGYFRVSTARQGASGLGLDAQQAAVAQFCREHGFELISNFTEIESGRNADRPVLAEAIAHARKVGATLVIAKLDRLARSVQFVATLMNSTVEFRAADVPEANRLLLHILAAVGEAEARACSDRTKAALQAAKARGVLLGGSNEACRNLTQAGRVKSAQQRKEQARAAYSDVLPTILALKNQGMALQGIADALNASGHVTRTGKAWGAMQVMRAMNRAA